MDNISSSNKRLAFYPSHEFPASSSGTFLGPLTIHISSQQVSSQQALQQLLPQKLLDATIITLFNQLASRAHDSNFVFQDVVKIFANISASSKTLYKRGAPVWKEILQHLDPKGQIYKEITQLNSNDARKICSEIYTKSIPIPLDITPRGLRQLGIIAAANKCMGILKFLITSNLFDKNAIVTQSGFERYTLLMDAAGKEQTEVAQFLIQAGAEVNVRDYYGNTALMKAASRGNLDIVESLLNAKADINARSEWHNTALENAIRNKKFNVVKKLLESGALISDKEEKNLLEVLVMHCRERAGLEKLVDHATEILPIPYQIIEMLIEKGTCFAPETRKPSLPPSLIHQTYDAYQYIKFFLYSRKHKWTKGKGLSLSS